MVAHVAFEDRASIQQCDDLLAFPSTAPNDHQFWRGGAKLRYQPAPDLQQQRVVLPRLNGAQDHEIVMRQRRPIRGSGQGGRCERRDDTLGEAQSVLTPIIGQRGASGLRVHNERLAGVEHGPDSLLVPLHFAGPAKFGVTDRNQVMRKVDRQQLASTHLARESGLVQAAMSRVQQDPVSAPPGRCSDASAGTPRQPPERTRPAVKKSVKQASRSTGPEHHPVPGHAHQRCGPIGIVLHVGPAHAIDAGGQHPLERCVGPVV